MALFEVKNLNFTYPKGTIKALDNINFTVNKGDFVIICGESGCGKSTLLKTLKKELIPNGTLDGEVLYKQQDINSLDDKVSVSEIGFVMQNPDNQIVTDKVWHELAFGLESLGEKNNTIRRKVAEISNYFGIHNWYHSNTYELSGGQKQLLNLASILVMDPEVLILDEPTALLDPINSSEFLNTLYKLNRDFGITIILVEHNLEEAFPMANKVIVMEKAKIVLVDEPRQVIKNINKDDKINLSLPTPLKIANKLDIKDESPLTTLEGSLFLKKHFKNDIDYLEYEIESLESRKEIFSLKEAYFRYNRDSEDVLKSLDLKIYDNEVFAILGGNGSGKSTLLKILSGVNRIYRGRFRLNERKIKSYSNTELYRENIAFLPQNPQLLFVGSTCLDDLHETAKVLDYRKEERELAVNQVIERLEIQKLLSQHPYDLSAGEQQKVALAKVLLMKPKIILLDEPTKGLDSFYKERLIVLINDLKVEGKTIIMATHDLDFAAKCANRCGLIFDGQMVSVDETISFFRHNRFYTTSASKMSKQVFQNTITDDMIIKLCEINGKKDEE